MSEGNGDAGLVVPAMVVHNLTGELEKERSQRIDAERKAERLERELARVTKESLDALEAAGDPNAGAVAQRIRLRDELRGIVPR